MERVDRIVVLLDFFFCKMLTIKNKKVSKVLIIGAGGVGTVVAHKVASVPEVFSEIMLASRTKSKCDAIAAAVGNNRIKTAQVNADHVPELVALIRSFRPDLVINVALPYQDLTIMDACLGCQLFGYSQLRP